MNLLGAPPANDPHEITTDEPYISSLQQRQQQVEALLGPRALSRLSSSSGSSHSLRRSSKFQRPSASSPPLAHPQSRRLEASSSAARPQPTVRFADQEPPSRRSLEDPRPQSSSFSRLDFSTDDPHPALLISPRTSSAILSALESLRTPFPFTPDLVEENADMSELGGAAAGRAANGGARAGGPVPVSQTQPQPLVSTIIPPSELMRRRAERDEAKRQAQTGQRRPAEEHSTRPAASAAGIASPAQQSGHQRAGSSAQQAQSQHPVDVSPPLASASQPTSAAASAARRGDNAQSDAQADAPAARVNPPQGGQRQSAQPAGVGSSQGQAPRPANPTTPVHAAPQPSAQPGARPTAKSSGFPHAFERWETLSSHWEGVTSYWIRKIESNTEETRDQPLLQQLSRHTTDLAAAGANLFHAVVELQRLRASSERKFQRWFYETRKESEREKEVNAALEHAIVSERQARTNDIALTLRRS